MLLTPRQGRMCGATVRCTQTVVRRGSQSISGDEGRYLILTANKRLHPSFGQVFAVNFVHVMVAWLHSINLVKSIGLSIALRYE